MVESINAHEERPTISSSLYVCRKLLNELSKLSIRAAQWTDCKWDAKYSKIQSELRTPLYCKAQGQATWHGFSQTCNFSHPCTSELAPTSICHCGVLDQTEPHVILESPLQRALIECNRLLVLITRLIADSIATTSPTFEEDFLYEEELNKTTNLRYFVILFKTLLKQSSAKVILIRTETSYSVNALLNI